MKKAEEWRRSSGQGLKSPTCGVKGQALGAASVGAEGGPQQDVRQAPGAQRPALKKQRSQWGQGRPPAGWRGHCRSLTCRSPCRSSLCSHTGRRRGPAGSAGPAGWESWGAVRTGKAVAPGGARVKGQGLHRRELLIQTHTHSQGVIDMRRGSSSNLTQT